MKKTFTTFAILASFAVLPMWAENEGEAGSENEAAVEFASDEKLEEGFITSHINRSIASGMELAPAPDGTPELGRTLTDYASAPKFGGYFVGKYSYTDQDTKHGGDGFTQRLVRLYVDGTILKDFKYRIQVQTNNDKFHMKDFFIEWAKHKEFSVKVGQFKRAFTFENPYNPWDVGTGDNALSVKKLAGMGDRNGEVSNNGGRDQGLQIQGDLLPSKSDGHRFLHYQLAVYNGQGINAADANGKKDFIGTIQVQPIKDLYIGAFGWTGDYVGNGVTVDRNRYAFGLKYEHDSWTVRGEYIHSQGHKISEANGDGTFSGTGKADGWYATVGVPFTKWCKVYVKYDTYRDQGNWASAKTIYSIAPNFQIHKNLMLQLQYNHAHDRMLADHDYNELWAETYVRL